MSSLINALKALSIASNRIDKLEKYNLDLASESHNKSERISRQQGEIDGLRAQVEQLREMAYLAERYRIDGLQRSLDKLNKSIEEYDFGKTPAQCLAEVRAQAFSAGFEYAFKRTSEGFNGECANDHLAYKWEFHRQHLDDLPDAGKEMLDAGINEFIQDQK